VYFEYYPFYPDGLMLKVAQKYKVQGRNGRDRKIFLSFLQKSAAQTAGQ